MPIAFILRYVVILFIAMTYSHFSFSLSVSFLKTSYQPHIHYTAKNLDELWSDYFSTKNPGDLLKIIKFINDSDDFLLFASYEIVNRRMLNEMAQASNKQPPFTYNDLQTEIEKRYPKNKNEMKTHVITVASAIWSMQSNQKQHPEVDRAVKRIMKQHPELDYWKQLHRILNN